MCEESHAFQRSVNLAPPVIPTTCTRAIFREDASHNQTNTVLKRFANICRSNKFMALFTSRFDLFLYFCFFSAETWLFYILCFTVLQRQSCFFCHGLLIFVNFILELVSKHAYQSDNESALLLFATQKCLKI